LANLPAAQADAGAVRASERHGKRQITVFTDPTPLRAGPVDVSILVQDVATGEAILGGAIEIEVSPRGESATGVRYRATSAAASNKLFQAASFQLAHAGWWQFRVDVERPPDIAHIGFEAEVEKPLPAWQALWPWFCWPLLVIGIFIALRVPRRRAYPA
jgi:hypothetical protein